MENPVTCWLFLIVCTSSFLIEQIGANNLTDVKSCPLNWKQWNIRSSLYRCNKTSRYDCLKVKYEPKFVEGCVDDGKKQDRYTAGTCPVFDSFANKRDTVPCPPQRYQDQSYLANQPGLIDCPCVKRKCTGEGQITRIKKIESKVEDDNSCTCKNGYELKEKYQQFCLPGTDDCCQKKEIDCGQPEKVTGSKYTGLTSTKYNSTFTFGCKKGFTESGMSLDGSSTVTCQEDGKWNIGNLNCTGDFDLRIFGVIVGGLLLVLVIALMCLCRWYKRHHSGVYLLRDDNYKFDQNAEDNNLLLVTATRKRLNRHENKGDGDNKEDEDNKIDDDVDLSAHDKLPADLTAAEKEDGNHVSTSPPLQYEDDLPPFSNTTESHTTYANTMQTDF